LSTQDIKGYFYRHFLGLVKVNSVSAAMEEPQVFSQKRDIAVRSTQLEAQMKVVGAALLPGSSITCSSRGFRFASQLAGVNEAKIKRYTPDKLVFNTFSKLKTKVHNKTKQALTLPQERVNRLQWQFVRPKKEGEMLLAWFGPIVEDAIAKSTLNKQRGTLLIWYNPQSRRFDTKGLYLYRRLGVNENLEWRWM